MSKEFTYWTSVCKRLFLVLLAIVATIICFKLAVFYMPFVIAFIISLMIEPLIRKLMKKWKLTRRFSSILVFIITFGIIIGLLTWGIVTVVSESSNLLSDFNDYYNKAYDQIQNLIGRFDFSKLRISKELLDIIENSSFALLEKISNYFQEFLTKIVKSITAIPSIAIYVAVTILALYFICTDKIYMLDELEHHLPEKWMKELSRHIRELVKVLGGYLKAQATLILISFVICLVGLYILYFAGLNVGFPLIIAIRNRLCGCPSYIRFWNGYDSLGNFIRFKWRFKIGSFRDYFMDYYVCCKTANRTKNCEPEILEFIRFLR